MANLVAVTPSQNVAPPLSLPGFPFRTIHRAGLREEELKLPVRTVVPDALRVRVRGGRVDPRTCRRFAGVRRLLGGSCEPHWQRHHDRHRDHRRGARHARRAASSSSHGPPLLNPEPSLHTIYWTNRSTTAGNESTALDDSHDHVRARLTEWFAARLPADREDVRVEGLDRVEMGHSAETLLLTLVQQCDGGDRTTRPRGAGSSAGAGVARALRPAAPIHGSSAHSSRRLSRRRLSSGTRTRPTSWVASST